MPHKALSSANNVELDCGENAILFKESCDKEQLTWNAVVSRQL